MNAKATSLEQTISPQKQAGDAPGRRGATLTIAAQERMREIIDQSPRMAVQRRYLKHLPSLQMKTIKVGDKKDETQVDWDTSTLKGSSDEVGVKMVAKNLHPGNVDEGDLVGTPPRASAQKDLMAKLPTTPSLKSTDKYIKGHLLNHNIGGPGEPFNLFPITASANSTHHKFVEKTVKKWVLKDKKHVDYGVAVGGITDNSDKGAKKGTVNSTFSCKAINNDTQESLSIDIVSTYNAKAMAVDTSKKGGFTFDFSGEELNFDSGSHFDTLYQSISAEDDPDKVNAAIDVFANKIVTWLNENYIANNSAQKAVGEIAGKKTKRFPKAQISTVKDVVENALIAYAWFNDKEEQGEIENDYPTIIAILKSKA